MLKKNSYSVILVFPKGDAKAIYNSHIHYSIQIKNNRKVSILVNMNYDLILPRLFQNKLGYIDSNKIRLINKYPNIHHYLIRKYNDSSSLVETLIRIKHNINLRPVCPICGKQVSFYNKRGIIFRKYCSSKCANNDKNVRNKIIETNIKRYGFASPVQNPIKLQQYRNKRLLTNQTERTINTKKLHNTLNYSLPEENIYTFLVKNFDDFGPIERQYIDNQYPWHADFYISKLKLYIEYQGYYTHNSHPFNYNNDKEILNALKVKYQSYYNKYGYWPQPITIWTEKDVEKRKTAINNNLNFIEVYGRHINYNKIKELIDKYITNNKSGYSCIIF